MKNRDGYIKLHRSLLEWEWLDDTNTFKVFILLLLNAAWADSQWRGITIKRGQLVTSTAKLSELCNLSVQQIKTALSHLKSTGEITIEATSQFSIITLKNYNQYQDGNLQDNQPLTNDQPAANLPSTSDQPQYKNNKEYKENIEDKRIVCRPTAVIEDFRRECPGLIVPESVIDERINAAAAALGEVSFAEYFRRIGRSDFLMGRSSKSFVAQFDWLMKPEVVRDVLSGKYDDYAKRDSTAAACKDYSGSVWG